MTEKKNKKIKLKLNLMLLKKGIDITSPQSFIKDYSNANELPLEKFNQKALLYRKEGMIHYPEWVESFNKKIGGINLKDFIPTTSSQGVTLFIEVNERVFAINWGITARYNVKDSALDKKFGIYTANKFLTQSKDAKIKKANSRVNEVNPVNKQRQYGISINGEQLYMSLEDNEALKELIIVDSGSPDFYRLIGKHNTLGIQVIFNEDEIPCLKSLHPKLQIILNLYSSISYDDIQKMFKGICPADENIVPSLFTELVKKLPETSNDFFLFEPEIDFDFSSVASIKYHVDNNSLEKSEMRLSHYLQIRNKPTRENLENDEIIILDDDGREVKRWPLFNCLYGELDHQGDHYIFSDGEWLKVRKDKYDRINIKINDIIDHSSLLDDSFRIDIANAIQECQANQSNSGYIKKEQIFNRKLSEKLGGEFFDEAIKQITLYEDRFEVCDVLLPDTKEFIHVKYNSGAQALSHLFNQGYVSASAYAKFPEYIKKVNAKISNTNNHITNIKKGTTIRYMIINGKNENRLTFFSKMSFEDKITTLEAMGFNVKLSWVNDIYWANSDQIP